MICSSWRLEMVGQWCAWLVGFTYCCIRGKHIHTWPAAKVLLDQIHSDTHIHRHTLSPWFVPLPISSAACGVSAGVRPCQLPPSASQWGPASRHLSGQLSLLSTLHCSTLCQASAHHREPHAHTHINTHEDKMEHVFMILLQEVNLFFLLKDLINLFTALNGIWNRCLTKSCGQMKLLNFSSFLNNPQCAPDHIHTCEPSNNRQINLPQLKD